MALGRVQLADHDDHYVFAQANISVPPGEHLGAPEASAPPDLVGLGEGFCNPVSVLGEKIGVTLRDVPLPLLFRVPGHAVFDEALEAVDRREVDLAAQQGGVAPGPLVPRQAVNGNLQLPAPRLQETDDIDAAVSRYWGTPARPAFFPVATEAATLP